MKNKPFSQSTGLNWFQKGLLLLLGLVIIMLGFGIYLYNDIIDSKENEFTKTKKVILDQTPMKKVEKIERFHGDEAYHIVYGINEQSEKVIIFYPLEGKEKNIEVINESDMLSENEILNKWKSTCDSCQLIKVSPAINEDTILWEITYRDEKDRYVLHYYSIEDGTTVEAYPFKEMFN